MNLAAIVWDFDPVFIKIGSFEIAYYGIMWVLAFVMGAYLFRKMVTREGRNKDMVDSAFFIMLLSTMIGARLGHCIFYEWKLLAEPAEFLGITFKYGNKFLTEPWRIVTEIRQGGLASHGAAIGLLIGIQIWSKKWNMPYVWLLDRIGIVVAIGGALIRFGNLMNSEIYGGVTDLPWGFIFVGRGETMPKHPTQIYEIIAYLITFFTLAHLYWKTKLSDRRGVIFGVFLIMLFGSRLLIESIKEIQEQFEIKLVETIGLNMGQILSIPFILAGIAILVIALRRKPQPYPITEPRKKSKK